MPVENADALTELMFGDLAKHKAIGWDIDETLFRGRSSRRLHAFIKSHPEIKHYVITHRTYGYGQVFEDLARYRDPLTAAHFQKVFMYDDDLWFEYDDIQRARWYKEISGPPLPQEIEYAHWKPRTCFENGITALVDDRQDLLVAPCRLYGVEYFNPYHFAEDKYVRAS